MYFRFFLCTFFVFLWFVDLGFATSFEDYSEPKWPCSIHLKKQQQKTLELKSHIRSLIPEEELLGLAVHPTSAGLRALLVFEDLCTFKKYKRKLLADRGIRFAFGEKNIDQNLEAMSVSELYDRARSQLLLSLTHAKNADKEQSAFIDSVRVHFVKTNPDFLYTTISVNKHANLVYFRNLLSNVERIFGFPIIPKLIPDLKTRRLQRPRKFSKTRIEKEIKPAASIILKELEPKLQLSISIENPDSWDSVFIPLAHEAVSVENFFSDRYFKIINASVKISQASKLIRQLLPEGKITIQNPVCLLNQLRTDPEKIWVQFATSLHKIGLNLVDQGLNALAPYKLSLEINSIKESDLAVILAKLEEDNKILLGSITQSSIELYGQRKVLDALIEFSLARGYVKSASYEKTR